MSRSPISSIVKRIQAQGPIGTQTDSQLQEYDDFYGGAVHFVAEGERDSRRVMPPVSYSPQLEFEHMTRWVWLRLFNQDFSVATTSTDKAAGWPDFMQLLVDVDFGGVEPAHHKIACAIEFLGGLRDEAAPQRRLAEISRPQSHEERGRKPDKRFVYGTWSGLYLLMEQCLHVAGVDWSDIDSDCFPRLVAPNPKSSESDITLRSWPNGYVDWVRRLEVIDDDTTFNILIPESLDFVWGRVLRLAGFERRDTREVKKERKDWVSVNLSVPKGQVSASIFQAINGVNLSVPKGQVNEVKKQKKDWIGDVLDWNPSESRDGKCFALSTRPKDISFGRRWRQLGKPSANFRELRHACPLALLLAAMAADLYLTRQGIEFNRLSISMADSRLRSTGHPAPEYQGVWNRAAARLGSILKSEIPSAVPPRRTPKEVTRFAGVAAEAENFVERPVALQTPTFDRDDDGTVLLLVPLTVLGADAQPYLSTWECRGITCFGQVYQPLTDELETPFTVLVDDDWVAESRSISLRLEPRPGVDTVLQRFWRGEVNRDDIELRAFIVDGGFQGQPRPVLFLQFIVTAL